MTRQHRADSNAQAVEAAMSSGKRIDPPSNVPLEGEDMAFFASVIAEFARDEWSAHQLELAAMLARTMADLEREQRGLREEGSVAHSERGTPVVNPRKQLVQMHAGTILALRRSLSLHARAQKGEARDIGKRRSLMKKNEISESEDDLLARPN